MLKHLLKIFSFGLLTIFFCVNANAQKISKFNKQPAKQVQKKDKKNVVQKTLSVGKKATFIIVGQTAKTGYKATKCTASKIAKPIIVKSASKTTKFLLKKSFSTGKFLLVKYIKYKFLP